MDSDEPSRSVASTSSSTTTSSSLAFTSPRYPLAKRKEKPPSFIDKVKMAWRIFFPSQPKVETPKEEVKRRLKMVLVADRCGMTPASLEEMKKTIIKALQDYVDIEGEDGIEVGATWRHASCMQQRDGHALRNQLYTVAAPGQH